MIMSLFCTLLVRSISLLEYKRLYKAALDIYDELQVMHHGVYDSNNTSITAATALFSHAHIFVHPSGYSVHMHISDLPIPIYQIRNSVF